MKRHEISEKQWNRIKDKFPPKRKPQGGRLGKNNREMLNRNLVLAEYRNSMADLLGRYGPWQSVYSRFRT